MVPVRVQGIVKLPLLRVAPLKTNVSLLRLCTKYPFPTSIGVVAPVISCQLPKGSLKYLSTFAVWAAKSELKVVGIGAPKNQNLPLGVVWPVPVIYCCSWTVPFPVQALFVACTSVALSSKVSWPCKLMSPSTDSFLLPFNFRCAPGAIVSSASAAVVSNNTVVAAGMSTVAPTAGTPPHQFWACFQEPCSAPFQAPVGKTKASTSQRPALSQPFSPNCAAK